MSGSIGIDDTMPSAPATAADGRAEPEQPAQIGRYRVRSRLGGGAMGVVYAAFDAELERDVAIKLVAMAYGPGADELSERLLREARALARLEHPNVVRVYEVGSYRGQIYICMERVHGHTLDEWLSLRTRGWEVVLAVLIAAGKGLQAAHAAGLVHRDFKPDNVLIDAADDAHVADFGLVKYSEGASAADPGEERWEGEAADVGSIGLTQFGNVLGTPAYMSPEQHFGEPVGPYSDQFSFCIVLYEALYGMRPFNGDSWAAIRMQVQEGSVPPPPLGSQVPRRLFRVLARGLAKAPGDRWPSMDALLEALTHDPWRVRVRVAAIAGGLAAASTASYAFAVSSAGERCEVQSQLDGAWDAAREAEVSRAFAATHTPFSADTWERVKPRLDAYAQAWASEWKSSCEVHASGAQTSRMMDLRVACLSRRRTHLRALVDVLAAADAAVVENAIQAVAALPSVAECGDEEALLTPTPMPGDPAVAAQVEEVRDQLARANALERTGQFERGLPVAAQVRVAADRLEYAPLSAEAALVEGRMLMNLTRAAEADAALLRAVQLGIGHDLHAIAAEAAAIRVYVVGLLREKPDEALAVAPVVEALVGRARDDGRLSALLLNNIGVAEFTAGEAERAEAVLHRSIEVMKKRSDTQDPVLPIALNNLGSMLLERGSLEAARSTYQQSVELFVATLGDNHPLAGHPLAGLGDVSLRNGQPRDAIESYTRALMLWESSYGADHTYLLAILPGLGRSHAMIGHPDEARRYLARAVEIAERHDRRGVELAAALEALGDLTAQEGGREQARGLYERAAKVFDAAAGTDSQKGARAALRAGELAAELGDRAGAIAWFERVLAKKTGPGGQGPSRADAALRLAGALADAGPSARACALIGEGRAGLLEDDPRRAEADALAVRACAKG
jgi:tetratricopeptide (TPR) repeat protein